MKIREPLKQFAEAQEKVLCENDHKGGWDNCKLEYLETRLLEELSEYHLAKLDGDTDWQRKETLDIANFCMMIWDKLRDSEEC